MSDAHTISETVDCRGMLCPLPIIRLRQALEQVADGQIIKLLATDPASWQDMPAFSRNTGHELLDASTLAGGNYEYLFRKTAGAE
jgi:tRNA 2-thiouridine synthesizing protein A